MNADVDQPAGEQALPPSIDPLHPHLPEGMHPVERSYAWVLRLRLMMTWIPLLVGALVLDNTVLEEFPWRGTLSAVVGLISLAIITFVPQRVYRRLGYKLGDKMLRVVRGWLFHTDTVVPFVRVQHIDVARGPLDKLLGTASLIVHTAGTHNSVVTLPGLSPEKAIAMRDEIRATIKTDWQ
ncbi:PH domain-containing protein [Sphingomicrobium flavum]|uniref:PH domain-containing protein n=1 Tax=Sphingomicrobium flavum TaxID=1229164 RepID=UPI0021ADAED2|nr:PH domain-containing protein [Sphingomicrobium flavum]